MDFVQSCRKREGSSSIWIDDVVLFIISSVWFGLVFLHFHWASSSNSLMDDKLVVTSIRLISHTLDEVKLTGENISNARFRRI